MDRSCASGKMAQPIKEKTTRHNQTSLDAPTSNHQPLQLPAEETPHSLAYGSSCMQKNPQQYLWSGHFAPDAQTIPEAWQLDAIGKQFMTAIDI